MKHRHCHITALLLILLTSSAWSQSADSLLAFKNNFRAYKLYLSKPDSSLILANHALKLAQANEMKYQIAFSYFVLSRAHWAKGNYLLSTEFAFKSLKIYENSSRIYHWGECLLSIGRTMTDLKNYIQADKYINQALLIATKHKDEKLLAEVLREKSFLLLEKKEYDSALFSANQGINIYEKNKDTLNASVLYGRKARIYFELKRFTESQAFITKALLLDSLVKNRRALGISYYQAAQVAFQTTQLEKAIHLLKHSLRISEELNNFSNKIRVHLLLAEVYKQKLLPTLEIIELRLAINLRDSLYRTEKIGQIQEMKSLYEFESRDKTILLLEKENSLEKQKIKTQQIVLISLLVVLLLLGLLSYVFWRLRGHQLKTNKELAKKNQEIELQNEEIQSQANFMHQTNQLKSKLLSVISHDLRGPINNLHALLEMVTRKIVTPEEFTELSLKIKSNLTVTQRTLENLLNWSLGQMEGIKTEFTAFNINAIIEDVAQLSEEAATRKQITFKTGDKMPIFVSADVNQVHLILRNLVNNAIKYSSRNAEVIIQTEIKNNFCYIHIEDSGIGMSKNEVEMILNSNEYFTKIGTDQEKGTGLGLRLCKDFIKLNGGEFSIVSQPKKATKVSFSLRLS